MLEMQEPSMVECKAVGEEKTEGIDLNLRCTFCPLNAGWTAGRSGSPTSKGWSSEGLCLSGMRASDQTRPSAVFPSLWESGIMPRGSVF